MLTAADTVVGQVEPYVQKILVHEVRKVLKQSPLVRPRTPNGMPMRVRVSAAGGLGWVGDGEYRYEGLDSRGKPWPEIPGLWVHLADQMAGVHKWDSAIVNWYDPDASLGWHQDKGELDLSLPIVTISLGDAASWAIRSDDDLAGEAPSRTKIGSGAVTLLAGPTRNYFHTVERIIPEPLFSPLEVRGRISITIRVAG